MTVYFKPRGNDNPKASILRAMVTTILY